LNNVKLEEYAYDYDLLGNKIKIVRHKDVNPKGIKENDNKEKIIHKLWNDSATFYYSYDALDRLIKDGGLQGNKTYEYDKRGNLIGISDRGRKIRDYEYDITGGLGLSYLKSGKARSYSYDGLGNRIGFKEYKN